MVEVVDGLEDLESSDGIEVVMECSAAVDELVKEPAEFCAFWAKVVEGLAVVEGFGLGKFDGFDGFDRLTAGKLTAGSRAITADTTSRGAGEFDAGQAKEEMLAILQEAATDPDDFQTFWETVAEVLEDLGRIGNRYGKGKLNDEKGVESVEGVDGLASTGSISSASSLRAGSPEASSAQVEDDAEKENAESAEDAETRRGRDVEIVDGVEVVDGVDGVGTDAGDGEGFDERTRAAMEALVRSRGRFGDLDEEQRALLRSLMSNKDRYLKCWRRAREKMDGVAGVEAVEGAA